MSGSATATASIDLSALYHNIKVVRKLVGNDRHIIAMIKGNAYGHGLVPIAKSLSLANMLGVASIDEAVALREANVATPIIVMMGFSNKEELALLLRHKLSAVVHHFHQLELLERTSGTKWDDPIDVWMKIDTGMHRLGFPVNRFYDTFDRMTQIPIIRQPFQIMTHLADADNADPLFTQSQLCLFDLLTRSLPGEKSVCNSAAILAHRDGLRDVVRPGIMLYGASPFSNQVAADFNLKPVMQLSSRIIAINTLKKGDRVGYGITWECRQEKMKVGVVSIGYGDGYPRHIEAETPVLVQGALCPILGRVSMDMIIIDLSAQRSVNIGDNVLLWGNGLPVESIAAAAGTISYELLCQLTRRVIFNYSH